MAKARELLGKNLTMVREAMPMTQADLAEATGLSLNMIQKIEYGKTNPSQDTLDLIVTALGCAHSDLYSADSPLNHNEEYDKAARQVQGVAPGETYDMIAAARAMKGALGMLEQFARISPAQQRVALSVIYNDPNYLAGLKPDDVPQWIARLAKLQDR